MAGLVVNSLDLYPAANITGLTSFFFCYQPAMHALSSILLVGAYAVQTVLGRVDTVARREAEILKRDVDSLIATETPIAWRNLLCNIGSSGCAASGAASGAVVASPSKSDPDYWYTWTRDSALVLKGIVDSFVNTYDANLQTQIHNYVISQAKLQSVSNPSGSFSNGAGLGEPKFLVNLQQFTGEWGRPQRDGPPLRAIALIGYARWLVDNGYASTAQTVVWPVIKNDLTYTAQYWNNTGFDLWEEVQGSSFFTIASSHRALVEGAALATKLGTSCASCTAVAPQVLCFLQKFWSNSGYVVSNINGGNWRSGKDVNSIITSIHNFDATVGCDVNTFQPCSDKALLNHKAVTDSFRSIYGVNSGIAQGVAVAVGRYSEDTYYNGNPWYLATLAAAEQLYDSLIVWKKAGSITVTSTSLPFFKDLVSSVTAGTYSSSTATYTSIINAVQTYADGYMNIAGSRAHSNGSMPEQFLRSGGAPVGARDLTWSYSAFLTAAARRAGVIPPSWNAASGNTVPGTCSGAAVAGSYTSATVTTFPTSLTANPSYTVTATGTVPSPTGGCASEVLVTFKELATTTFGQTIKIIGSIPALGSWNTANAVALSAAGYTSSNPLWTIGVLLPAGTAVQYKFINVGADGSVKWESDPNRSFTVPSDCSTTSTQSSSWR